MLDTSKTSVLAISLGAIEVGDLGLSLRPTIYKGEAVHAPSPLRQEPPRSSLDRWTLAVWSEATQNQTLRPNTCRQPAATGAFKKKGNSRSSGGLGAKRHRSKTHNYGPWT